MASINDVKEVKVTIFGNGVQQHAPIENEVTWETDRKGNAGKLTFKVLKSEGLSFNEGDAVTLHYDGKPVFYGFVFAKSRDKQGLIEVTAYDQLRYLKNKETYVYENKTADQVIKMIASDFKLKTGTLDSTKYVIESRIEDNQTLLDIIHNALDLTMINTQQMYILYDDFGKITLKNLANMKTDVLVDSTVAENFDYKTTIDDETYNQVVLYYENKDTKTREKYVAQSSANMNKWGILKYTDTITDPSQGKQKADALLSLYNRVSRSLTVNDVMGSLDVRAGTLIPTKFAFDIVISNYLLVEKVTHRFKYNRHTMDLTLVGAE